MDIWQQSHLRQQTTQQNNKEHVIPLCHQFPSPVSHAAIWTAVQAGRREPTGRRSQLGSGLLPGNSCSDYAPELPIGSWPSTILLWNTVPLKYTSHAADNNLLSASEQCNLCATLCQRQYLLAGKKCRQSCCKKIWEYLSPRPSYCGASFCLSGTHRPSVWAAPAMSNLLHVTLDVCSPSYDILHEDPARLMPSSMALHVTTLLSFFSHHKPLSSVRIKSK